jgi:hypothetical protein
MVEVSTRQSDAIARRNPVSNSNASARELLNAVRAKDPEVLRRFSATLPRLARQPAAAVAAATISDFGDCRHRGEAV